jgi:NADH-quinone oxidoreductase subunit C
MTTQEIFNHLTQAFPGTELVLEEVQPSPVIRVPREILAAVALKLRDDEALHFECLMCLSGVDKGTDLQTVYHLHSMKNKQTVALRCVVSKEDPSVPTVCRVWPTAEWHEREAWDMFGIRFENHPDHRRILCADDWEGHPLRKDYKAPESFHGIPLTNILPESLT